MENFLPPPHKIKVSVFFLFMFSFCTLFGFSQSDIHAHSSFNITNKHFYNPFSVRISIKGKIVDENDEPLIGVNMQVKGSEKGTCTEYDGEFTLEEGGKKPRMSDQS